MKIKIAVTGAAVVMDMEENEAMKMFQRLSAQLLGIALEADQRNDKAAGQGRAEQGHRPEETVAHAEEAYKYRGFLYVKCPDCGNTYGYCSNEATTHFYCRKCGRKHVFTEPLKPLYLNCECGKYSKYMTNMEAEMFDVECIQCHTPVAVKYNRKKGCYETIRN